MEEYTSTSIRRIGESKEVMETLKMTQEEFDQIVSQYGTGQREERKTEKYEYALKRAKVYALPDEELKEENFNRVNMDGFQKAVVLLSRWTEMIMSELFKKRSFRIEITYNTEARKTDFAIYTPKECASDEASFDETIDDAEKESIEKAVQDEPTPQEFDDYFVIPDQGNRKVIIAPPDGTFLLKLSKEKSCLLAGIIQDCVRKL